MFFCQEFNILSLLFHTVYNKFSQSDREKQLFSLKGAANTEKRQKIYRFMLQHMTDEQRFQLTAKLSQEVCDSSIWRFIAPH